MGTWLQEKIDIFLAKYRNCPVGIYGTGLNAERVLKNVSGYYFACVITEERELWGTKFCGISVTGLADALAFVKVIVLAAIPASAMAIYRRIANKIPAGIITFDMMGVALNGRYDLMRYLRNAVRSSTDRTLLRRIQDTNRGGIIQEKEDTRLHIDSVRKLTGYCIVPMVMAYLPWMIRQLEGKHNDVVLFVSRDGYLLEKMYRKVSREHPELNLPAGKYFYTSREAVTHAISLTEQDIVVLCSTLEEYPKASAKEHLEKVFGIPFSDEMDKPIGEWVREGKLDQLKADVLKYSGNILHRARECREGYKKYITSLELEKYENVWLVDLVTHGTAAYGLQRMLERPVNLLALGATEIPNAYIEFPERVKSLYGDGIVMGVGSFLGSMFSILEMAFSSFERQASGFDKDGDIIFADGTAYAQELLTVIHGEIEQFIADYTERDWYLKGCTPAFAEAMLGLLHPCHSRIDAHVYDKFIFSDRLREETTLLNVLKDIRGET